MSNATIDPGDPCEPCDPWGGRGAREPRVSVVTGAGSGLGRAIAIGLGRLGWPVALGARRVERLEDTAKAVSEAGGRPFVHVLDVCDPASVEAFFAAAEAELGCVDVLVNNAGMAVPGELWEVTAEEVKQVFETNTLGPIYTSQTVIRAWRRRGHGGDLVLISSEQSRTHWPHMLCYGASKAAIEFVTHGLERELAGTGSRVAVLQVGPAESEFGFGFDAERAEPMIRAFHESGVLTHGAAMRADDVAAAVILAVTAPAHVTLDLIGVRPVHPRDEEDA
jgi:NADP-dependent 3-hydroxy acid dehydrogenase YdfG